MDLAIEKAKKCGIAMVVVRNSTHYGIAGYYSSMAAERGLIGISGTNTRPSVAPTGGVENLLGTNPISVAFPIGKEYPFCFDCATSMIPRGKVEYYTWLDRSWKNRHTGCSQGLSWFWNEGYRLRLFRSCGQIRSLHIACTLCACLHSHMAVLMLSAATSIFLSVVV